MATVLLISRDDRKRAALESLLASAEHTVTAASDAASLGPSERAGPFHLVILDLAGLSRSALAAMHRSATQLLPPGVALAAIVANPTRRSVLELAQRGIRRLVVDGPQTGDALLRLLAAASTAEPPPTNAPTPSPAASAHALALPRPEVSPAEELKRRRPLIARTDLLKLVDTGSNLRAMRPIVQQVLSVIGSPGGSVADVSRAVKQDSAMALKLMRLANSVLYSRGDRVENIADAVKRVGLAPLRQAILSMGVIEQFNGSYLDGRVTSTMCWEHSISVGVIAAKIGQARQLKGDAIDALFTAGLLHDVGKMILFEHAPELMRQVVEVADELAAPWEDVEARLLMLNHAEIADRILRVWKFPPHLTNMIALHHLDADDIRARCPAMAEDAMTLALANRLAHLLRLGSSGNEALYPIDNLCAQLALGPGHLAELTRGLEDQISDIRLCMLASSGATSDFDPLPRPLADLHASAQLQDFTGSCGWLPLAWNALGGVESDTPDLILARIPGPGRLDSVSTALSALREKPGQRRPLILLAAAPLGAKVAPFAAERTVIVLTEPVTTRRLIEAVKAAAQSAHSSATRAIPAAAQASRAATKAA